VESFNRFSQWIGFGNRGVIADNDPIEQEKPMKFNALLTNAVILQAGYRQVRAIPGRALVNCNRSPQGWEVRR
jgi:hypothetical protein